MLGRSVVRVAAKDPNNVQKQFRSFVCLCLTHANYIGATSTSLASASNRRTPAHAREGARPGRIALAGSPVEGEGGGITPPEGGGGGTSASPASPLGVHVVHDGRTSLQDVEPGPASRCSRGFTPFIFYSSFGIVQFSDALSTAARFRVAVLVLFVVCALARRSAGACLRVLM